MGSTEKEREAVLAILAYKVQPDWLKAEGPRHRVTITRDFYCGVHEVTQKQYEAVMGKNPSYFSRKGGGKGQVQGLDTDDFPVESVSWDDAQAFVGKLNDLAAERSAGRKYRLPTEAEWEYCCRAGADVEEAFTFDRPSSSASSTRANFNGGVPFGGGAKGPSLGRTCKVGSYKANPFGLYDMHGNVWEWCEDWYDFRAYQGKDRRDPRGPRAGQQRVLRGGGWNSYGDGCRSGYRVADAPAFHGSIYGFRVVCVAHRR
jgi:formylglycine-generating enzyme required for sulfatase activity